MTFDLENFTVIFIWSKNSESDVKSITMHAIQSSSNQNDSSWKLILWDNEKQNENSVLSKVVDKRPLHNSVFRFEKKQVFNE